MKKKFIKILLLTLIVTLNTVVFAGRDIEIPEYILVQMKDGSIEEFELDTYLYGVVKKEMGTSYKSVDMNKAEPISIEALKAQAVASRSYAVYQIMKAGEDADYHVTTTTSSQVYEAGNVPQIIRDAVDETSGQVITYDDEVACAYFFSTSGGHTEASENVWSAALPYLRGVEDPYEPEIANNSEWTVTFTQAELKKMFPSIGTIKDVEITEVSENDRVTELVVTGSKGSKTLTKNSIRTPFGTSRLKSQWFDVEFEDGEATFEGYGFGHGVGMSQYGAMGMGAEGFTYDEILKWYYTDIEILGLDDEDYIYVYDDEKTNKDNEYEEDEVVETYWDKLKEQKEEKIEIPTPLLDSVLEKCTTNWLLEWIKK